MEREDCKAVEREDYMEREDLDYEVVTEDEEDY